MRGKGVHAFGFVVRVGITPAYAGKRAQYRLQRRCGWDHPRICGEKVMDNAFCDFYFGSPPHMRGKGIVEGSDVEVYGITPAYAGKRATGTTARMRAWDHPCICGEKESLRQKCGNVLGSPPHVQGKGLRDVLVPKPLGITPAYAGKRHCQDGQQGDT